MKVNTISYIIEFFSCLTIYLITMVVYSYFKNIIIKGLIISFTYSIVYLLTSNKKVCNFNMSFLIGYLALQKITVSQFFKFLLLQNLAGIVSYIISSQFFTHNNELDKKFNKNLIFIFEFFYIGLICIMFLIYKYNIQNKFLVFVSLFMSYFIGIISLNNKTSSLLNGSIILGFYMSKKLYIDNIIQYYLASIFAGGLSFLYFDFFLNKKNKLSEDLKKKETN